MHTKKNWTSGLKPVFLIVATMSFFLFSCTDVKNKEETSKYITHTCNDCVYETEFQYIHLGEEVHIQPVVHWKSCKNWPYKNSQLK